MKVICSLLMFALCLSALMISYCEYFLINVKLINLTFITVSLEVIMELKKLDYAMTVCKVASELDIDLNKEFYFIGKTDEEYSLV